MSRRGVTLAECVVALGASAVILAALQTLLVAATRARAREAARREARGTIRAAAAILGTELQAISAPAGDIVSLADTALTVRAVRAQASVCAQPRADRIVLEADHGTWLRTPDPARDAVRILLDGDPDDATDDGWWVGALATVSAGTCPDGSRAVVLTLAQPLPGPAVAGAPARVFETVDYRLYRDASGQWMLGTRTRSSSGWSVTSPLAGPLAPANGLHVIASTISGVRAVVPTDAVMLDIGIRSQSAQLVFRPGGARAPVEDSLRVAVAVGP